MVSEFGIAILPDLLANDLDLVIVGTAPGRASAKRRHYYAGPGQRAADGRRSLPRLLPVASARP